MRFLLAALQWGDPANFELEGEFKICKAPRVQNLQRPDQIEHSGALPPLTEFMSQHTPGAARRAIPSHQQQSGRKAKSANFEVQNLQSSKFA